MKFLIRLFSLSLFLFAAHSGISQEEVPEFTVQIGNFVNPKPADFEHLKDMGFVFTIQRPTNHTDVFMGGYSSENQANKVAESLKQQGYDNAFVSKLNTEAGQSVTVVQLATVRAGDKIDWEKMMEAGQLFFLLNDRQVKIMVGGFADLNAAKAQLPRIKGLGFADAFIKNVNNALLHEVTDFETGGRVKKALIPLDFTDKEAVAAKEKPDAVPTTYDDIPIIVPSEEKPILTAKGTAPAAEKAAAKKEIPESAFSFKANMPEIRANVKRSSAIELQKVLKQEGAYKGSLDGYYGKGTRASYNQVVNANRQLQKYSILAKFTATPENNAATGSVQYYINNLWDNPQQSLAGLQAAKVPIAKAYRAYFLFVTEGANFEVNTLMNQAIREAFSTYRNANMPSFDPTATYDYRDLDQLLTHMRFVHEASTDQPAAPCWLFRRHPGTALKAFGGTSVTGNKLNVETCGGFWEWQEVQLLNAIAADLAPTAQTSEGKIADSQSELARLYLTPKSMDWNERKTLKEWNDKLWQGIDAWSTRDPMLAEIGTALKISYFQTQVLLEDFYMDEGFDEKDAQGLALASLKALVGHHLDRFV